MFTSSEPGSGSVHLLFAGLLLVDRPGPTTKGHALTAWSSAEEEQ